MYPLGLLFGRYERARAWGRGCGRQAGLIVQDHLVCAQHDVRLCAVDQVIPFELSVRT